ncbi:MAG: hypothetical protein N2486_01135 [Caloramator sp.]|nr:hypothetical protein [Caloramator sp.]
MVDKKGLRSLILLLFIIVLLIGFSGYLDFLPSTIKSVVLVLFVLLFIFYESKRPVKSLKDINRVYQRRSLFSRKKAIETLEEGLNLEGLKDNEKLFLSMQLAIEYYKLKDYKKACEAFKRATDEAIRTDYIKIEEKFLIKLVGSYILNDKREEAQKIYNRLLALGKCDKSKIVEDMLKNKPS